MNLSTYQIMYEIIDELDIDDKEQIDDYRSDCFMNGAFKTANYIKHCQQSNKPIHVSLLKHGLSCDFSGC